MPVDVKALRELAEKATPGPWADEISEIVASDQVMTVVGLERCGRPYMEFDALVLSDKDRAFIAAANPSTVLALLDEIERKDRALREIDHEVRDNCLGLTPAEDEHEAEHNRTEANRICDRIAELIEDALSPATPREEMSHDAL